MNTLHKTYGYIISKLSFIKWIASELAKKWYFFFFFLTVKSHVPCEYNVSRCVCQSFKPFVSFDTSVKFC